MKKIILTIGLVASLLMAGCSDDPEEPKNTNLVTFNLAPESRIAWKGKAADGNFNEGTIQATGNVDAVVSPGGELKRIHAGLVEMPVLTIEVTNLPAHLKPVLENHLKTSDFFYMAMHPKVSFRFLSAERLNNDVNGYNYQVRGEMTLLGQTHALEFPARIILNSNVLSLKAKPSFKQSLWGMNYHLDESYPADDRLLDGIDLSFDIKANR
ncbi:hypothetical protein BCY91_16270 [Pelobium manganitolerans]|uniref:Lipid/polyisoprenoid-binding YceI-like domain-containing protein n=1 Tax=Pelobium manganitolerans TaxID=1842495 RepID=A0A419S896_9SPHI|nr:YceI family protein [Pelobium manganitolerans]RKD17998.1 hypothetical protein BCY91_16270 [Pelobium manganitolerans]